MNRKRIVIISEKYYACGASMAAFRLADGLAESGWDSHFLYHEYNNLGANPPSHNLHRFHYRQRNKNFYLRIKTRVLNKIRKQQRKSPACPQKSYESVKAYIESVKPDYINIHNTELSHKQVLDLQKLAPVIWSLHDLYPLFGYNYSVTLTNGEKIDYIPSKISSNPEWQSALKNLINNDIQFTAPSQWVCNLANSVGAKNSTKIVNPISGNEFFPIDRPIAKAILGVDVRKKVILFIQGRYAYERKNIKVLTDYLDSEEANKDNKLLFIVVGAQLDSKYKNRPDVTYTYNLKGAKSLRQYYSAADYTCIPSLEENYPNIGIESALCGTPIIGSNRGGITEQSEIIAGSKTFDPYNPTSFFNLMEVISTTVTSTHTLEKQQTLHDSIFNTHNTQSVAQQFLQLLTGQNR
jgi:glycosyltransferase involved in cell wall biosynthesis